MAQRVNICKYGDAMAVGALAASIRDMVPFTAARALRPTCATPAHQRPADLRRRLSLDPVVSQHKPEKQYRDTNLYQTV